MRRTTISLPDETAERLEREARRRGSSVSGVVREAVEKELNFGGRKPRRIPWAGLFTDPDLVAERLDEALGGWADESDRDRR
jgi:Arc/MetJ-type ribon-helix-helix transcriptional regulator